MRQAVANPGVMRRWAAQLLLELRQGTVLTAWHDGAEQISWYRCRSIQVLTDLKHCNVL